MSICKGNQEIRTLVKLLFSLKLEFLEAHYPFPGVSLKFSTKYKENIESSKKIQQNLNLILNALSLVFIFNSEDLGFANSTWRSFSNKWQFIFEIEESDSNKTDLKERLFKQDIWIWSPGIRLLSIQVGLVSKYCQFSKRSNNYVQNWNFLSKFFLSKLNHLFNRNPNLERSLK